MSGNDLPPLDECLSAMDERIEFLSSALTSLSAELTSRKPAAGGAASPLAVELGKTKAKLKEAEAKLANNSTGDGVELQGLREEVRLLQRENAELKSVSSPLSASSGDGRGSASEIKAMKSKLVQANNEIDQLKKELAEKTEELEAADDQLGSLQQQLAARNRGGGAAPLQFEGLDAVDTPKVVTPTAIKRSREPAKKPMGRRRMSLASSFKAEGEDKLGRIERMVELLTNIPTARNVDALVSAVVNGTFTLMAPGVTAVALWLAPHNKTYTAIDGSTVETSNELGSLFMKRIHEDPAAKVNVKRDDYMMYLGAQAKEDDMPEAVMCLPIFSAHGHQQLIAILELRNAKPAIMDVKGEFGSDDEELVQAITHQAGTSLDNVFYNNKMAQALQRYEYTQTDMSMLTTQIVSNGLNLFEADRVMLALHNTESGNVEMHFSDEKSKTLPQGSGATWTVINSRVELSLPQLSSGNGVALRKEFDFADDEDPGMVLHPIIDVDGVVIGVIGIFGAGTELDDELLQLVKLFSSQAATLIKNCELYTNAMSQNAKVKNKLELLDVSKAFASELDQHTLMMTIIEKTRTVLDADRCALFILDEARNQMWASLHDGTIIRTGRGEGIVGWVATNNQPLNITDAYSDARFNTDVDKETGYRTNSILAVPVHDADQKLTGVIQMINKRGGPFGSDDQDMLQMIASQAGVTLNNAAIFDAVRKDQDNFNVLMDISKKLSSELNIQKLIQSIMDSAKGLLDCDRSTLFLADHSKNELYSYMADGVGTEIRLPLNMGIAGAVATTGQLINIPDAYEDSRFNQGFDRQTGYKTTSILCVPVMSSKGSLLGVCQMINKGGGGTADNPVTPNLIFETSDESLLGAFMSQAAVSIENAQLFEKAMSQKQRLESTLASIQNLVLSFDSKGMLTGCNDDASLEKYFDVTAESIGSKMSFKKWLNDCQEVVQQIDKTMTTARNYESLDSIKVTNEGGEEFHLKYSVNSLVRVEKDEEEGSIGGSEDDGGCVLIFEDLSEKKKMTSTLGRYLSEGIVEQVLGSGADVLGGVRQKVTILFSDIRSFTTISEGMDAVDLVAMLNDYFTYELDPIFDNGGILDKFIGDAIMACFGVPLVSQDNGKTDACMSCKCALEQLAALEVFNEMRVKEKGPDTETFAIGIGLNTNKVVSGNIGSDKRMEYTVIGDGVNLASRLEGITKTYGVKVCMSEFTNQEVTTHFITREIDTVAVKGKADGIKIFELIAAKDECDWSNLSYHAEEAKEHPTFQTRLSALPQAKKLQPFLSQFDVALNNYRAMKFDDAIAGFKEIVDAVQDPVSKLFIGRCEEFIVDPPEAGWDGVYRPKSK